MCRLDESNDPISSQLWHKLLRETVTSLPCNTRLFSAGLSFHASSTLQPRAAVVTQASCGCPHFVAPYAAAPSGLVRLLLPKRIASCSPMTGYSQWQRGRLRYLDAVQELHYHLGSVCRIRLFSCSSTPRSKYSTLCETDRSSHPSSFTDNAPRRQAELLCGTVTPLKDTSIYPGAQGSRHGRLAETNCHRLSCYT